MWISKKKWNTLVKRVAALEEKIQSQPQIEVESFTHQIREFLQKQISESHD